MPPNRRRIWDTAEEWLRSRSPQAYDQLLWEVVTAPPDDLRSFAARFYDVPYDALPVPIMVAAWRILGLESAGDVDTLRSAAAGITFHSDTIEEANALVGIRRLLQEAKHEPGEAA